MGAKPILPPGHPPPHRIYITYITRQRQLPAAARPRRLAGAAPRHRRARRSAGHATGRPPQRLTKVRVLSPQLGRREPLGRSRVTAATTPTPRQGLGVGWQGTHIRSPPARNGCAGLSGHAGIRAERRNHPKRSGFPDKRSVLSRSAQNGESVSQTGARLLYEPVRGARFRTGVPISVEMGYDSGTQCLSGQRESWGRRDSTGGEVAG